MATRGGSGLAASGFIQEGDFVGAKILDSSLNPSLSVLQQVSPPHKLHDNVRESILTAPKRFDFFFGQLHGNVPHANSHYGSDEDVVVGICRAVYVVQPAIVSVLIDVSFHRSSMRLTTG